MTRDEVLRWIEMQLGVRDYRNIGDGGAIQRLEWIAVAHGFGDWSLEDIKEAIDKTADIRPLPRRIGEIHRLLERKRWEKQSEGGEER